MHTFPFIKKLAALHTSDLVTYCIHTSLAVVVEEEGVEWIRYFIYILRRVINGWEYFVRFPRHLGFPSIQTPTLATKPSKAVGRIY